MSAFEYKSWAECVHVMCVCVCVCVCVCMCVCSAMHLARCSTRAAVRAGTTREDPLKLFALSIVSAALGLSASSEINATADADTAAWCDAVSAVSTSQLPSTSARRDASFPRTAAESRPRTDCTARAARVKSSGFAAPVQRSTQ
jgi:hypothetical protein